MAKAKVPGPPQIRGALEDTAVAGKRGVGRALAFDPEILVLDEATISASRAGGVSFCLAWAYLGR